MVETFIVAITALLASLLTFFSGFGLGTILVPAFMLFFPIEIAVAITGIVHLLNNIFKFLLIGKNLDKKVLFKFGAPAIVGALAGALVLVKISSLDGSIQYEMLGRPMETEWVNVLIAVTMVFFSLFELLPSLKKIQFGQKQLVPGGLLSGFFGGVSGHQGALRSAFLLKIGLTKEAYIATGIAIACFVDFTRLPVYFGKLEGLQIAENLGLIVIATLSAFTGAVLGRFLLNKITIDVIQNLVGILIIILAIGLGLGII